MTLYHSFSIGRYIKIQFNISKSRKMNDRPSIGNYYLGKTIGLGSQAKVKLGENMITKMKVAIKIIKKSHFTTKPDLLRKLHREMSLMRVLDHPHLLKLIDVCETDDKLFLILEYAKNGELFDYLSERGFLSAQVAMNFFRQIIYGLEFLHTHSLCHRDLKPQNILLDQYNNVKIGDFGFARWMKTNVAQTQCGSPLYAAPEVIKGGGYDGRAADIWGTGVIFYTLLCVCIFLFNRSVFYGFLLITRIINFVV
ncbi:CAMK family protein kinase [Tritrichomonas foetus]|uniref:CAMK family protein kinase n=1 Tax=Tritrichomonas foetus TaxID=1144522 RepID=A0A1J4J3X9_9EUKA|nr:CAMK family protein kinase [Tritrichomonas foetus]|eukprot:OHS94134.1 CAMK family protein kinase [Tritrichomonas foetus]